MSDPILSEDTCAIIGAIDRLISVVETLTETVDQQTTVIKNNHRDSLQLALIVANAVDDESKK